jgi:hypothetical protein
VYSVKARGKSCKTVNLRRVIRFKEITPVAWLLIFIGPYQEKDEFDGYFIVKQSLHSALSTNMGWVSVRI